AVSGEDIAHARDAVSAAQAALDAAREQAEANHALTDRTSIEEHPRVQAAASKVRDAYLSYARNTLPAPVTGYVARRSVQVGQRVAPGTPLMAIVPLDGVWVDANFKEGQLKHMRIGQAVTLSADVYGSGVKYHGWVVGFLAGTGSARRSAPRSVLISLRSTARTRMQRSRGSPRRTCRTTVSGRRPRRRKTRR